jgi:hypothetical protein
MYFYYKAIELVRDIVTVSLWILACINLFLCLWECAVWFYDRTCMDRTVGLHSLLLSVKQFKLALPSKLASS